jgi:poly-gamma-glutamate synthesis protein (capsule biosynthesis protein)
VADIVICSFHWGISGGYEKLTEYQPELGRFAADNGADLVFGHHPHLLQGIELRNGVPIFYSLGNFTFARHNAAKGQELESLVVRCSIRGGKLDKIGFLAASCDADLSPSIRVGEAAEGVLAKVRKRSAALGTQFIADGDGFLVVAAGSDQGER